MSTLELRRFQVSGDWTPFFEQLPGWYMSSSGAWTDGESAVVVSREHHTPPEFGFLVRDALEWEQLVNNYRTANHRRGCNDLVLTTPSGIRIVLSLAPAPEVVCDRPRMIMNHVALNTSRFSEERRWYQEMVGNCAVLARDAAWEPVSQRHLRDIHFFRSPSFYITIRERTGRSCLDHVGWMTDEAARVDEMAGIVRRIGWEIVFGPAEIDGSYLFHFRGADDRIHDFFWPTPSLVEASHTPHEIC